MSQTGEVRLDEAGRRRVNLEPLWRRLFRLVRVLGRPKTYLYIFMAAMALTTLGATLVYYFEGRSGVNSGLGDWESSIVYMSQNVFGVGLGALSPHTRAARLTSIVFASLAAGLRGVFVATIVSTLVNRLILEGQGLGEVKLRNHVVICGWNPQVRQMVEVLEREAYGSGAPIVLLALVKENPMPSSSLHFLNGDPSLGVDLERAGIKTAQAAVIVSDSTAGQHSDSTLDARAVLTALAIHAINPALHTVAEVRDPANRPHFLNAQVDELIVSAEMSEGLLARAALNRGLANVFSELLRLDTPAEMYIVPTPPALSEQTFQSALMHLHLRRNSILVGIIEQGKVTICPPLDYSLRTATSLVLVSSPRPDTPRGRDRRDRPPELERPPGGEL